MWLDDDGVSHTVALGDPTQLMDDVFRGSLDGLLESHRDEVIAVLDRVAADVLELNLREHLDTDDEAAYELALVPFQLRGVLASVEDLDDFMEEIELRWRLDVVETLLEYVEPWDDPDETDFPA